MNENDQDLINQRDVIDVFNVWMNSLPGIGNNGEGFTFREIPTVEGESEVDYSMWWNHLCVGMVEVKCFTKDYDNGKFLIDRPKLKTLWKYKERGVPGILIFSTPSGIWMQDIRLLTLKVDQWQEAPEYMMATTNHGKEKRKNPFKGYLIPKEIMVKIA